MNFMRYAPITFVDVERSFSAFKNLLTDNRQSFLFENIKRALVVQCNRTLGRPVNLIKFTLYDYGGPNGSLVMITLEHFKSQHYDPEAAKWNITTLNAEQPMLITTEHDEIDIFKTVYLVPELCIITELTKIIGIQMNDAYQRTYMNHLDDIINKNVHKLIICVTRSLNNDLCNKINRKLCIGTPVPSQLVSLKQVTINDYSKSIKTAIRINCKVGGVPWLVRFPMKNCMAVGLDIYQDLHNSDRYFCAVMASMDDSFTRYFSFVESLCKENISEFFVSTIANALCKYKNRNGELPKRVFIYRDGLEFDTIDRNIVSVSEILLLMKKQKESYCGTSSMVPFAYITIIKKEATQLFSQYGPTKYRNPPPGTIVDTSITDPITNDFFLISHTLKSGTVSPTYYRLALNTIPYLTIDEVHMFTYMLTHMYYNCSHTIRVPAPCRMAYKLAHFCANSLQSTQNILLHGLPFFF
ncbi:piwi-like protein Siwi [Melanaphis sacchari]|uniref:piwi-like protein Siwi n=1 Tax=Melanaphis sacchari TaxID=742174 RepID=UPI000DC14FAD|nr:piwi-like protein Siwi [Melanaphis sacchari]